MSATTERDSTRRRAWALYDELVEVLAERCHERLRLPAAARALNVSPRTLQRALDCRGTTFRILRFRIRAWTAAAALVDGLSVAEATHRSGYAQASHFTVFFKTAFGVTPSAFASAARYERLSWGPLLDADRTDDPEEQQRLLDKAERYLERYQAVVDQLTPLGAGAMNDLVETTPPAWTFRNAT